MQQLLFEPSWDKALSSDDRKQIEEIFLESNSPTKEKIKLTPIWEAVNYKDELLITVLIHNFTQESLTFSDRRVTYFENDERIAERIFTLPTLNIPSENSMPWTFIFPVESQLTTATLEEGHLELEMLVN